MKGRIFVTALVGLVTAGLASPAWAAYDVIIDDTDAVFMDWDGNLQVGAGDNSYGGGYRYVTNWGASGPAAARVRYYLPNVPAGVNLYAVYAWSPSANSTQWHPINIAADGTENFAQNIPWAGQFGTNKQWLGFDVHNEGGWLQLGPGPQSDPTAGSPGPNAGKLVYINGSTGQQPYLYVEYQPWFNNPIAFDAVRVVLIPEPATIAGMGLLGLLAMRRRRRAAA
ncbi:MAG: hypothetical protein AMXMBFR83_10090 [Phycisphaerae bacterium]